MLVPNSKTARLGAKTFAYVILVSKLVSRLFRSSNLSDSIIPDAELANHSFKSSNLFSCVILVPNLQLALYAGLTSPCLTHSHDRRASFGWSLLPQHVSVAARSFSPHLPPLPSPLLHGGGTHEKHNNGTIMWIESKKNTRI